jgi:hypothetical protein
VIVTAHQPNFLPGKSVIDKIAASDAVVWLDEVQYTKGGYINRNKLPDGSWMTVPVAKLTDGMPINRVQIQSNDPRWSVKLSRAITQAYGKGPAVTSVANELLLPYRSLVGLNASLLNIVLSNLFVFTKWHWQSHLDGGHAVVAVSDNAEELLPISDRLAMMVDEVGGTTYLSGPSGRRYLDEKPFVSRGIEVRYFSYESLENPCVLSLFD